MFNRFSSLRADLLGIVVLCAVATAGCSNSANSGSTGTGNSDTQAGAARLEGRLSIDGSSTVYPISAAVVEEFQPVAPRVKAGVSQSGTSGGMKRFVLGEIDICDASRPIKDSERQLCAERGIEFIELTIAFDGLSLVANRENDWCDCLTLEQLKTIWQPGAEETIKNWSDVNPDWPELEFKLFGPGTDSGTFEFFTQAICGEEGASRPDFQPSEDDNMLVGGVAGEKGALCYFGYAYYAHNKDRIKLIAVDAGDGCVLPTQDTVRSGTYTPLSRPLFLYVRSASLERPEVRRFVEFYLENVAELATAEGYVPVSDEVAAQNRSALQQVVESIGH